MTRFALPFRVEEIAPLYERDGPDPVGEAIANEIVPRTRQAGFLPKEDFLTICKWKTPRSQSLCGKNPEDYVREVTKVCLATPSERLRIEALTLLDGVDWPTASAILHWIHPDPYPILDFRALWSLGCPEPKVWSFDFWWACTTVCRKIAADAGVSVRVLDRALWKYSEENQGKRQATHDGTTRREVQAPRLAAVLFAPHPRPTLPGFFPRAAPVRRTRC